MPKPRREESKTFKHVFEPFTNTTILKLISKGQLDGLESPISMGKEANVFTGLALGERVAIKIYRIATCDFHKMYEYLAADPRIPKLERNKLRVVLLWARREYRNLFKAREAGVRVPTPRALLNNVLVMEFIGEDNQPAPRLKGAPPENLQAFFDEVIKNMQKLYKAKMIHADLSAFNILNHNEEPVFIDLSQATTIENPNAQEYLERDVRNVCTFFRKKGLKVDDKQVMQQITGKKTNRKL